MRKFPSSACGIHQQDLPSQTRFFATGFLFPFSPTVRLRGGPLGGRVSLSARYSRRGQKISLGAHLLRGGLFPQKALPGEAEYVYITRSACRRTPRSQKCPNRGGHSPQGEKRRVFYILTPGVWGSTPPGICHRCLILHPPPIYLRFQLSRFSHSAHFPLSRFLHM